MKILPSANVNYDSILCHFRDKAKYWSKIAIFTARHIARAMLWQDVDRSVSPTHAGISSKRLNVSSNFFHHRVATASSFFVINGIKYSHSNGGVEYKGVLKNRDFRPIYCFISEMMQHRPIVRLL